MHMMNRDLVLRHSISVNSAVKNANFAEFRDQNKVKIVTFHGDQYFELRPVFERLKYAVFFS